MAKLFENTQKSSATGVKHHTVPADSFSENCDRLWKEFTENMVFSVYGIRPFVWYLVSEAGLIFLLVHWGFDSGPAADYSPVASKCAPEIRSGISNIYTSKQLPSHVDGTVCCNRMKGVSVSASSASPAIST